MGKKHTDSVNEFIIVCTLVTVVKLTIRFGCTTVALLR